MIQPVVLLICINLFFPSFSTSSDLDISVDPESEYGAEYFPLTKNVEYQFESNMGETVGKVSAKGNVYTVVYESSNMSYSQSLISNSKGVYLIKTESKAFFFESSITYDKPLLRIPFPLEIGKKWSWNGYEIKDEDSLSLKVNGEVLREETLDTKLGKLNCIVVSMEINSEKGSYTQMTQWLAPNIGLVKLHAKVKGGGITGLLQKMMGFDEIYFKLTSIKQL